MPVNPPKMQPPLFKFTCVLPPGMCAHCALQEELYMEGVATLSDILTQRKFFTKSEMLARKALEEKVKVSGTCRPWAEAWR